MSFSVSLHLLGRAPVAGRVKTRMIPALGPQGACDLQQLLLERALQLSGQGLSERFLWLDGLPDTRLQALAQELGWTLVEQPVGDLGERMRRIATLGLLESDAVILIGNDCPALDGDYLQAACEALREQSVVIGPADDGGYVLLGLRTVLPSVFSDMPWGTEQVFPMTLQRLQQLDLCPALLPVLWDVDRPEDLPRLAELNMRI